MKSLITPSRISAAVCPVFLVTALTAVIPTENARAASSAAEWVANGATGCQKFLTPDVTSAIMTKPGMFTTLSPQSCSYKANNGSIAITLTQTSMAAFAARQEFLADPKPLAGVGDKAVQHAIGILAIKGDRGCGIDTVGAPGAFKLSGAALGTKLGAICNKLFALP